MEEEKREQADDQKLEEGQLGVDRARKVIATKGATALDLRDQDDFAESHIAGAVNVSEDELDSHLEDVSKDDPVIVVCADGDRSSDVAESLREQGYEAASIKGGMRAWEKEDLPSQPPESDQEYEGPRRPGPLGE
jgi:rhodanese-related sulfurtransferase